MSNDIKPCPFCGNHADKNADIRHSDACYLLLTLAVPGELMVEAWNTRAPVRVKLPRRYEDTDGYLCLSYTGTVASLKAQGVEVEQ